MFEFLQAYPWLLVIAIFLTRIADQTIGTLRTISVVRGYRLMAVLMGFLEVFIWINVIGHVIQNLHAWYLTLAYAGGFAAGQGVGIWVESKLAIGHQVMRIISRRENNLADKLWEKNYPATEVEGNSRIGPIDVIFVPEKRENMPELTRLINDLDPEAMYTIGDIRQVGKNQRAATIWDIFPRLRWVGGIKRK
ncbi:DUF2179 domain-containing protein [bacterium]|nr:DUF2179 domain-containing protein [bacterium]